MRRYIVIAPNKPAASSLVYRYMYSMYIPRCEMSCSAKYISRSVADLFILNYQQVLTFIPCSTSNPMELTLFLVLGSIENRGACWSCDR
jgi:hypothetical protein